MDEPLLRAWRSKAQGLDGSLAGATPAQVLERSGWARSVGGVGPYLTFFSRAGVSRARAEQAVANREIHELPAARGCTYVVPASDFALALKVGQPFGASEMKTAASLGVTEKEIDKLCDAVIKALAKGPLDPAGIKDAVGSAVRNLGDVGKKKGLITTLPVALGRLQTEGGIRRVPLNGRLDTQRFAYTLWRPNPLAKFKLSRDEAGTELARRFFRWVGPASLQEFQCFSLLGVKAVKAAAEPLGLVPALGSDRLLLPDDLRAWHAFKMPSRPQYSLVSSLDAISATRRDLRSMVDAADLGRKVYGEKGLRPVGGVDDLPSHAILDRGRLIGLWEYDVESRSIVWATFGIKDKTLEAKVGETEAFVRDQLEDARSFSLDSPKSRAPRIAALRKWIATAGLAMAAGCGSPDQPDVVGGTPTIVLVSGTIPTDTADAPVPTPLRLEIRDGGGRPVPGVVLDIVSVATGDFDQRRIPHVLFAESSGRRPSATISLVTGNNEPVTVYVSRGPTAGTGVIKVTGRVGRDDALRVIPWTILPGNPGVLEFAPHDTAVYVGAAFRYRLDLQDSHGNPLPDPLGFDLNSSAITVSSTGEVAARDHGRVRVRGHLGAAEAVRWVSVVPRLSLAAVADGILLFESDGHARSKIAGSASAGPLDSWPGAPQLVVGKFGQLLAVPVSGQGITPIPVPGITGGEFLWPRFDPAGQWIYVSLRINESNGAELWRVRSDGTQTERLTTLGIASDSDVNPHPSPDGTKVVFSTDRRDPSSANFSEITILDLSTRAITFTTARGFLPRWSPDGARIGFLTLDGRIKVIDPSTGAILVATTESHFDGGLDWSPDGQWLVGTSDLGVTFVRAATGEELPVRALLDVCCVVIRR